MARTRWRTAASFALQRDSRKGTSGRTPGRSRRSIIRTWSPVLTWRWAARSRPSIGDEPLDYPIHKMTKPGRWGPGFRKVAMARLVSLVEVRLQATKQLRFGQEAHNALNGLAILEQDHRGNSGDAEALRAGHVAIHVQLGNFQRLALLLSDLLQHRRDHLARPAPLRPEVH